MNLAERFFNLEFKLLTVATCGLIIISLTNYTLFHVTAEIACSTICFCLVIISLNSYKMTKNSHMTFLAIAYAFVGIVEIFHTITFKGMNIFSGYDSNLPTQLWIICRYLESVSLVLSFYFLRSKDLKIGQTVSTYALITTFFLALTFQQVLFPDCYIEGKGLTTFKIASEYIICTFYLISIFLLNKNKKDINSHVYINLLISIIFSILSEFAFICYTAVQDIMNMAGHILLLFSFYYLYKAIIKTSIEEPFETLFQEVKNSNEVLLDVLKFGQIGYWEYNTFTRKITLSNEIYKIIKQTKELTTLQEIQEILKDIHNKEFIDSIANDLKNTGMSEFEKCFRNTENECLWLHCKIKVKSKLNAQILEVLGIVEDITSRKNAEQELIQAKHNAEISNNTKRKFLAAMSHEFRTPLNSIIGFSEMIISSKYGDLSEKGVKYINNVLNSGKHMLNLVNDLLDINKIETNNLELCYEQVESAETLETVISSVYPLALQKNIQITKKIETATINADNNKLRQILYNLISNAIKFTPNDGHIKIRSIVNGEYLIIEVEDNGIGIEFEDYEKIFAKFKRVNSPYVKQQIGTGLGLSITKQLVELHGGTISFTSELGIGSTFRVSLPMKPTSIQLQANLVN